MKHIIMFALMVAMSMTAYSQKVGHVDLEAVITKMPRFKQFNDSFTIAQKKFMAELEKKKARFETLNANYMDSVKIWPLAIRADRSSKLSGAKQRYELFYQIKGGELDSVQNAVVEHLVKKVKAVTKIVAKEKGITYVMNYSEQSGLILYYEESHDLTGDVKKKLGLL